MKNEWKTKENRKKKKKKTAHNADSRSSYRSGVILSKFNYSFETLRVAECLNSFFNLCLLAVLCIFVQRDCVEQLMFSLINSQGGETWLTLSFSLVSTDSMTVLQYLMIDSRQSRGRKVIELNFDWHFPASQVHWFLSALTIRDD